MNKYLRVLIVGVVALCFTAQSFWSFASAQTVSGNSSASKSSSNAATNSDLVRDATLVASNTGWLLTEQHLRWTIDNGKTWRDITPAALTAISNVFFLDTQSGWAIGNDNSGNGYQIAHTSDAGLSWQTYTFVPNTGNQYSAATLDFVDAQHGFLMLKVATNVLHSDGDLFTTSDGGQTWTKLATPPIGDGLHFTSVTDGWLAGGPGGNKLFVTHNGGNSWQSVQVTLPTGYENAYPTYGLPTFFNSQTGILPVTLVSNVKSALAYYITRNNGSSWQLLQTLSSSQQLNSGIAAPVSIVDESTIIGVPSPSKQKISVASQQIDLSQMLGANFVITKISFKTAIDGWVLATKNSCDATSATCTQEEHLLAVSNKGQSVQDITPSNSKISTKAITNPGGQGFDSCSTPSTAALQDWWTNGGGRYKSFNFYFADAINVKNSGCNFSSQSASWVTSAFNMGWGIIPTWSGLQAPCTSGYYVMSSDPTTAATQAVSEADQAANDAINLGLSGSIIYYDMENYSKSSSCDASVSAFVNSWVQELHNKGFKAGAYFADYNGPNDFANIANQIDAAWIKYINYIPGTTNPVNYYIANESAYGLPNENDSQWQGSRFRQYTVGHSETLGSTTLHIDSNVIDGPVARGIPQATDGTIITKAPDSNGNWVGYWAYYQSHRYYISSMDILHACYGQNPPIYTLDSNTFDAIPAADAVVITKPRDSNGTWVGYWALHNGTRFYIPTMDIVQTYYDSNHIATLCSQLFDSIPAPSDGTLLSAVGQGTWVMYGAVKFFIPNPTVFNNSGYNSNSISTLPLPLFNTISSDADNIVLKDPDSTQNWIVLNNKRHPYPSTSSGVHTMPTAMLNTIPIANATISANPNPPILTSSTGTSTLSWNTDDGVAGQVYVSVNGGTETLVAQAANGTQTVNLAAGNTYTYNLYMSTTHSVLLATTKVTVPQLYTYYLPYVANNAAGVGGSYTTYVTVQNVGGTPAGLSITYYDNGGNTLATDNDNGATLAPNTKYSAAGLASGQSGAATIVSTQPLAIVVSESGLFNGKTVASSYPAINTTTGVGTTIYAPIALNHSYGNFSTGLVLHNTGTSDTVATIQYYNDFGNPATSQSVTIKAGNSAQVLQSDAAANLPSNFSGWAVISSNNGQSLAGIDVETNPDTGFMATVVCTATPGKTLYVPVVFQNAFGNFVTGMQLVNPNGAMANVTVQIYRKDGTLMQLSSDHASFQLPAHSDKSFFHSAQVFPELLTANGGFVGTAIITSDQPLLSLVNQMGSVGSVNFNGSFGTLLSGAAQVNMPIALRDAYAFSSGLQIVNASGVASTATISYYDKNGNLVNQAKLTADDGGPIKPGGSINPYQGSNVNLPDGFDGTAVITADTSGADFIVVGNISNAQIFYTYAEPN